MYVLIDLFHLVYDFFVFQIKKEKNEKQFMWLELKFHRVALSGRSTHLTFMTNKLLYLLIL